MPTVVQIGAGKIGRGFLGQIYADAGWSIVFLDIVDELVAGLNARGGYDIEILTNDSQTRFPVTQVSALHPTKDVARARDAIATADLIGCSVGVPYLKDVAAELAPALAHRAQTRPNAPVDVIVCENKLGAAEFLRDAVLEHAGEFPAAAEAIAQGRVGFVGAVVGRTVPALVPEHDPWGICTEPYCLLPVDQTALRNGAPDMPLIVPVDNLSALEERKLFVHNDAHAAAAYLGRAAGLDTIEDVMNDDALAAKVRSVMAEAGSGIVARHGFDAEEQHAYEEDLMERFVNRALADTVLRVGADPIRKLGPHDRLIGGARCALDGDRPPQAICDASAAAIHFDAPDDPSAEKLRGIRESKGVEGVLQEVCQLTPDDALWQPILAAVERR